MLQRFSLTTGTYSKILRSLYHCLFAPCIYIVAFHAHPVRCESHNQRNANGEVATEAPVIPRKMANDPQVENHWLRVIFKLTNVLDHQWQFSWVNKRKCSQGGQKGKTPNIYSNIFFIKRYRANFWCAGTMFSNLLQFYDPVTYWRQAWKM